MHLPMLATVEFRLQVPDLSWKAGERPAMMTKPARPLQCITRGSNPNPQSPEQTWAGSLRADDQLTSIYASKQAPTWR